MAEQDSISLREFINDRLARLEKQLDDLAHQIIGRDRFDLWCNRLTVLEKEREEHDERIVKLERSIWLMQILVGILVPIVTAVGIALVIAWVTGSMEIRFK